MYDIGDLIEIEHSFFIIRKISINYYHLQLIDLSTGLGEIVLEDIDSENIKPIINDFILMKLYKLLIFD